MSQKSATPAEPSALAAGDTRASTPLENARLAPSAQVAATSQQFHYRDPRSQREHYSWPPQTEPRRHTGHDADLLFPSCSSCHCGEFHRDSRLILSARLKQPSLGFLTSCWNACLGSGKICSFGYSECPMSGYEEPCLRSPIKLPRNASAIIR